MDLSQNVELTSRKWFSDNSCVQAMTLSRCCSNSLWKPNTHTYSFSDGWGNEGRGTLSAPDSAGSLHLLTGHWLAAERTPFHEQPEASGPGPFPLYKQEAGALTRWVCHVRKRHWGGFQQNAFLLQEGTVYVQSSALTRGSLDETSPALRPHAQPWGCSWGRLLHLPDP